MTKEFVQKPGLIYTLVNATRFSGVSVTCISLHFFAQTDSAMDIVGAVGDGEAEQFPVADVARGCAIDVNAEATGDAVGGSLPVQIKTGILTQRDILMTVRALDGSLGKIYGLGTMGADGADLSGHGDTS